MIITWLLPSMMPTHLLIQEDIWNTSIQVRTLHGDMIHRKTFSMAGTQERKICTKALETKMAVDIILISFIRVMA